MRYSKLAKGILVMSCTVLLAGCGASEEEQDITMENQSAVQNETEQKNKTGNVIDTSNTNLSNIEELLNSALLNGTVSGFQSGSFQVVPIETEDNGQTAKIAAPGTENNMLSITVNYGKDCVFQIANINDLTGEVSFEEGSADEVKKETQVAVYGEKQDSGEIFATEIMITRYQGATGVGGN